MSTKVLSITLKTIDQATAPIRGVISQIAKLTSGIASAMTSVRTVVGVFAAAVAGSRFVGFIGDTIQRLDELGERSRVLGITAEAIQTYEYAAKQANVQSDELFAAIRKGTQNMAEYAATMSGPAADAMRRLGVSTRDTLGGLRPMGDLLEDIRKKTASLSAGDRLRAYTGIFGKGGNVVERLTAGTGFNAAQGDLRRLGGLVSTEDVARANTLSDAVDRVSIAFRGLKDQAVLALAGPLTTLLESAAENMARIGSLAQGVAAYLGGTQNKGGQAINEQLGKAVVDALKEAASYAWTLIKEGGELIRVALVNALSAAINIVSPMISDQIDDMLYKIDKALPSWLRTGATPGAGMRAREDAGNLGARRAELARIQGSGAEFFDFIGTGGIPVKNAPKSMAIEYLVGDVKRLESVLKKSSAEYQQSLKDRSEANRLALAGMVKDTKAAYQEAAANVNAANDKFAEAVANAATIQQNTQYAKELYEKYRAYFAGVVQNDTPAYTAEQVRASFKIAFDWAAKKVKEIASVIDWVQKTAAVNSISRELNVRSLEATGQGGRAAQLRLDITQDQERARVQKELGASYYRVRDALESVQAAERQRLLVDTTLSEAIAALTQQENNYAQAVQVRAAEVAAGTITARVADIANKDGLNALLASTQAARSSVQGLIDANPALREQLLPTLTELAAKIADIQAKTAGAPTTSFFDGLRRGWKDVSDKVRDYAALANDLVSTTVNGIAGGIASAFTDAVEGVKSFGAAVADMGRNVLRVISQMIVQFLVMKAIVGIGGAIAGGAGGGTEWAGPNSIPGTFANKGGFIRRARFAAGGLASIASLGMVPGPNVNIDRVPAMLTAGEYVSNRASTRKNMAALQYANNGGVIGPVGSGAGGGIVINQTIHVSGGSASSAQAAGRAAREGVLSALDDAGVREKIKRVVG